MTQMETGTSSSSALESTVLKVDHQVMKSRVEALRFSIVGRITLEKGDEPWNHLKLKEKLGGIWLPKGAWKMISLGRGFYQIVLTNEEDYNKVWVKGMLSLHPDILRLQRWYLGFDPAKVKSTHVQAWIRLYDLPWGFWTPKILLSIRKRIGIPLKIDNATLNGEFGHYARILVDIDLSLPIKSVVHLEFGGSVFDVRIVPEKLPEYYKVCSSVGHSMLDCRSVKQGMKDGRVVAHGSRGNAHGLHGKGRMLAQPMSGGAAEAGHSKANAGDSMADKSEGHMESTGGCPPSQNQLEQVLEENQHEALMPELQILEVQNSNGHIDGNRSDPRKEALLDDINCMEVQISKDSINGKRRDNREEIGGSTHEVQNSNEAIKGDLNGGNEMEAFRMSLMELQVA